MAAKTTIKIGNVTGAIYQAERPLHLNPDGSAQASLTLKCATETGPVTIPEYLTPHPFIPDLKCYESDLDQEPGGIARITTIYKGVLAKDPKKLAQSEFHKTLTEAPIETHPVFAFPRDNPPLKPTAIAAVELALQNCQPADKSWNIYQTKLFEKKRRGIDSYLKVGGVFRITYCSTEIPRAKKMEIIGHIAVPPDPAPAAPTGQNYLCMGISWVKQAAVVTITEEYQLSGQGGWDPDLYKPNE